MMGSVKLRITSDALHLHWVIWSSNWSAVVRNGVTKKPHLFDLPPGLYHCDLTIFGAVGKTANLAIETACGGSPYKIPVTITGGYKETIPLDFDVCGDVA